MTKVFFFIQDVFYFFMAFSVKWATSWFICYFFYVMGSCIKILRVRVFCKHWCSPSAGEIAQSASMLQIKAQFSFNLWLISRFFKTLIIQLIVSFCWLISHMLIFHTSFLNHSSIKGRPITTGLEHINMECYSRGVNQIGGTQLLHFLYSSRFPCPFFISKRLFWPDMVGVTFNKPWSHP